MENNSKKSEKLKYKMCSRGSCCPVLTEIENDKFTIIDDYEGKVILTKEELILLKDFLIKNLDN